MDKAHAERIIDLVISMDPSINALLDEIELIDDDAMRSELKHSVQEVMKHLMLGIIVPIEQLFSDLNPDK